MAKIKIDSGLLDRVKEVSEVAGYSSVEEFITHMIEKELSQLESAEDEEQLAEQLVEQLAELSVRFITGDQSNANWLATYYCLLLFCQTVT